MTRREKDLVRYSLGYLATGDGRRARRYTITHLSREDTKAIRQITNEMHGKVAQRMRFLGLHR